MKRLLFLLLLGGSGAVVVRRYVAGAVLVQSASMEPTLITGRQYLLNRLVYRIHPPRRGDIIDFISPVDPAMGLIKRVIAVPGDQIELRQKKVFLNGARQSEPYAVYKRAWTRLDGDTMDALTVPPGCVFVLGDNRDESNDSTVWKDPKTGERVHFVPYANIQGKVIQYP